MSDPELEYVRAKIGESARASGRMRVATCDGSARLQQKWIGDFGSLWLDLPMVEVPFLPPHPLKLKAPGCMADATMWEAP